MLVNLSHVLTKETPGFAGGPSLTISPIKEIKTGGSSNSYNLHFSNHLGTHIDWKKDIIEQKFIALTENASNLSKKLLVSITLQLDPFDVFNI